MAIPSIDFFDKYKFDVSFEIDGNAHHGVLKLGGGSYPHLFFNRFDKELLKVLSSDNISGGVLICKDLESELNISLHEVDVKEQSVFCKYVSIGRDSASNEAEIVFTGVSVWLDPMHSFKKEGESITRDISIDVFDEKFTFNEMNYSLKNAQRINFENPHPLVTNICSEYAIILKKESGVFESEELRELVHELRNLFSLLIGVAVSVKSIHTYSDGKPYQFNRVYFPTVLHSTEPLEYKYNALTSFNEIHQAGNWGVVLLNYFSKNMFRNIWNRLPISFDYKGVWEYKVLSRVIVIEKYASEISAVGKRKMNKEIFNQLKSKLSGALTSFEESLTLSEGDRLVFNSINNGIRTLGNTSMQTLQDKYDYLMGTLDNDLKEVINFTGDDFLVIKQLRNDTAHGNEYKKVSGDDSITYEMEVSDRLLLLLMCFCYLELGFTPSHILSCLSNFRSPIVRNVPINKRALDLLNGSACFIEVIPSVGNEKIKGSIFVVLLYDEKNEFYSFNAELTGEIQKALMNRELESLQTFVENRVGDNGYVETLSKVYIKSNDEETEHYNVIKVTVKNITE